LECCWNKDEAELRWIYGTGMHLLTLAVVVALAAPSAQARAKRHKRVKVKDHFDIERIEKSLAKLGPEERLVQLCDLAAMQRIRKEKPDYKPDRAVADAVKPTVIADNTVKAEGGAFRSNKKWYALSYDCTASGTDMKVVKFQYEIGDEIPENKWASFGLWE